MAEGRRWREGSPGGVSYSTGPSSYSTATLSNSPTPLITTTLFFFFRKKPGHISPTRQEQDRQGLKRGLQIINLTSRALSTLELNVLSKGLSFVPTTNFCLFTWTKDLNLFIRRLKWHKFFKDSDRQTCARLGLSEGDSTTLHSICELGEEGSRCPGQGPFTDLEPSSRKMPPPMNYECVDIFLQMVTNDLEQVEGISPRHFNLSQAEMTALIALEKDKSIIIKSSDKGGEPGNPRPCGLPGHVPRSPEG